MTLYEILDKMENIGLKDCRLGAYTVVTKKLEEKTDKEFISNYIKNNLSKEITKYLSEKISIYKSDNEYGNKDIYSTELFVFSKEEFKKLVNAIENR